MEMEGLPGNGAVTSGSDNIAPTASTGDTGPITPEGNIEPATTTGEPPPSPPITRTYTEAEIRAWTHDDFKKFDGYNRAVKSATDRQIAERTREMQAQSLRGEWHNFFAGLPAQDLGAILSSEARARHETNGQFGVREIRAMFNDLYPNGMEAGPVGMRGPAVHEMYQAADAVFNHFREFMRTHPELSELVDNWDELESEVAKIQGPEKTARFLAGFVERGVKKSVAGLTAKEKAKTQAAINEATAELHETLSEPDVLPPAGGAKRMPRTLDEARAWHARGELSNQEMRQYLARVS